MTASEMVAASCRESLYKDERHEWRAESQEFPYDLSHYMVRRCVRCTLIVLLRTSGYGGYFSAPKKVDEVIYAFYERKPE